MTRLISTDPQRRIGTSRRSLTGRVALGNAQSAAFESALERDWLEQLDFLPEVTELQVQPFRIEYTLNGRIHRYTPDIAAVWVREHQSQLVVYEVKPADELRAAWASYRPRFVAATRYCRARGWRFKIVNERHIRTPRLGNIRFLRRYLRMDPSPEVRLNLLQTLRAMGATSVQELMVATCGSSERYATVLSYLWSLVANFEVHVELDAPLTMNSVIAPID